MDSVRPETIRELSFVGFFIRFVEVFQIFGTKYLIAW